MDPIFLQMIVSSIIYKKKSWKFISNLQFYIACG